MPLQHFIWILCLVAIRSCAGKEIIDDFLKPLTCHIDQEGQTICTGTNLLGHERRGDIVAVQQPDYKPRNLPTGMWILNNFPHAQMQEHGHWWHEEIAPYNKCHDLSRKALLLKYRAKVTEARRIEFHQKVDRTCSSVDSVPRIVQIMFYKSMSKLIVPLSAFVGADLALGHAFTFHGPLDIYEIALVDIGDTYQAHIPTADVAQIQNDLTNTSLTLPELDISLRYNNEHEFSFTDGDHSGINFAGKMFKIVYSSKFLGVRRLSVEQNGKTVFAQVLFQLGKHLSVHVPVSFFHRADPLLPITKFLVRGPLFIHHVEIVNVAPPLPGSFTSNTIPPFMLPTILSDSTVGSFATVHAFDDMLLLGENNVDGQIEYSESVQFHFGHVVLPGINDFITEYFSTSNKLTNGADAIRITFTSAKPVECLANILFVDSSPKQTTIAFHKGTIAHIVISLRAYGDPSHVTGFTIYGPLTIHRIELATAFAVQPSRQNINVSETKLLKNFLNQMYLKELRLQISVTYNKQVNDLFCEKNVRLFYTQLSQNLSRPAGFLPGADKTLNIYPIKYSDNYAKFCAVEEVDHYLGSIGRFVGSAILHGHLLDLQFSPEIYKKIFGIDTDSVSFEVCSFQYPELINDERLYSTGPCCKHKFYLEKLTDEDLAKQVVRNTNVFLEGLHHIVPMGYLDQMSPLNLMNLMHGKSDFELEDWMAYTVLDGYAPNDLTVQLFWNVLSEWDAEQQSKLVYFVTGSPRIPFEGFRNLNGGPFTLRKIHDLSKPPSSDTCGNILNLPEYADLDIMRSSLNAALKDPVSFAI